MTSASRKIVMMTGGVNGTLLDSSKASHHILMGSRSLSKAAAAIAKLQDEIKTSNTMEAVQVDLTNDGSIARAFEHVGAEYERIDVLVNNAGDVRAT